MFISIKPNQWCMRYKITKIFTNVQMEGQVKRIVQCDLHIRNCFLNRCTICLLSTTESFKRKQLTLFFDVLNSPLQSNSSLGVCNWCYIISYVYHLNMFESNLDFLTNGWLYLNVFTVSWFNLVKNQMKLKIILNLW